MNSRLKILFYFIVFFIFTSLLFLHPPSAHAVESQNTCRFYFIQSDVFIQFTPFEKESLETAAQSLANLIGKTQPEQLQAKAHINADILHLVLAKKLHLHEILEFRLWFKERVQFYIELKTEGLKKSDSLIQQHFETLKFQKENQKIKHILAKYNAKNLSEAIDAAIKVFSDNEENNLDVKEVKRDILFMLDRFQQLDLTNEIFCIVVQFDHFQAVDYFIKRGVHLLAKQDYMSTPLHLALTYNPNPAIIQLLIENTEVHQFKLKDEGGNTHLHTAAQFTSNPHIIRSLIALDDGTQLNFKNRDSDTPLHIAADNKNPEILFALLEAGADPTLKNSNNTFPLLVAAANPRMDAKTIQKLLVSGAQAHINAQGEFSENSLSLARKATNHEVVAVLLEAGAQEPVRLATLTYGDLHAGMTGNSKAAQLIQLLRPRQVLVLDDIPNSPAQGEEDIVNIWD